MALIGMVLECGTRMNPGFDGGNGLNGDGIDGQEQDGRHDAEKPIILLFSAIAVNVHTASRYCSHSITAYLWQMHIALKTRLASAYTLFDSSTFRVLRLTHLPDASEYVD